MQLNASSQSLTPEAPLSPKSFPVLMAVRTGALAADCVDWTLRPGTPGAVPVRSHFGVTGSVPHRADLVGNGVTARYKAVASTLAQVRFQCDTATSVLVLYGRLRPESARAFGRMVATGDQPLATAFEQCFKGIEVKGDTG